jgi:hypothetical protein
MEPSCQPKHVLNRLIQLIVIWMGLTCTSLLADSEIMTFIRKDRAYVLKQWGPAYTTAYTSEREILT